jgi:hypothetical protein
LCCNFKFSRAETTRKFSRNSSKKKFPNDLDHAAQSQIPSFLH